MPMTVGAGIGSDLDAVPEQGRKLEELGYDFISIGEGQRDPFLPLTIVAEHTERIHFGTSVAIAFPRVPYITATVSWDLSRFSGGRFVLGLGTQVKGHNERRFSVPWVPPGPRLRDYIQCMRAIWDSWQNGTKPDYEGEHYQYKLNIPNFNPGPIEHPEIKVVIAALNPFNSRLAGEVGDGIDIHPFCSLPLRPRGGAARGVRGRRPRREGPERPDHPRRGPAGHRPQRGRGGTGKGGNAAPDLLLRLDAVLLQRHEAARLG